MDTNAAYLYFDNDGYLKYYDTDKRDIMPYNSDQWYHIKIEWNCTLGKWNLWVDGLKCGPGFHFYGSPSAMDTIYFGTTGEEEDYYSYIDAVSYSWDPNYNVGDNFLEGLVISCENNTKLEWTGYSLDNQNNITIFGNKTIPMLEEGVHSAQIFGNDSLGTMYQSEKRYFNISSLPINIETPENKTYTDPMYGYYPATYGFENDLNGVVPEGFVNSSGPACSAEVIDEFDSHKKVVRLLDSSDSKKATMKYHLPSSVKLSTLEFWYFPDTESHSEICLWLYGTQFMYVQFLYTGNLIRYYDGEFHEFYYNYIEKWYHLQFEIDYDNKQYDIYIDGNLEQDNAEFRNSVDACSSIVFSTWAAITGVVYIDAIGLSEDPNYTIGDNLNDGLLLSIEDDVNLELAEFSFDNQDKQPILGNKTLPIPEDGVYTVQVFGRDNMGNLRKSDVRYFTVNIAPYVKWKSPGEDDEIILPPGDAIFKFQYSDRKLDDVELLINGTNFGSVWNMSSIVLSPYTLDIDGYVNITLYGYQEPGHFLVSSDSRNITLSKLTIDVEELIDYDTEFVGEQLYMILHDPNGDGSFSGYKSQTGLSIGFGASVTLGWGIEIGVGDEDLGLKASGKLEFKASTSYDFRLEITQSTELTSSQDDSDRDFIGPGRGDTYWGEAWSTTWYLKAYNRTYFNGTKRYESPRIDYTIVRSGEVFLGEQNAPLEWRERNPVNNGWANVNWYDNKSLEGGRPYNFEYEVETSETRKVEFEIETSLEVKAGKLIEVTGTFSLGFKMYLESETKNTYTTSYTIHDDESTDLIIMEYGIDKTFGTPIFRPHPSCRTSKPLEYDTFDYVPPVVEFPNIEMDSNHDGLAPCMDDSPIVTTDIQDEGGIQVAYILYSMNDGLNWDSANLTEQAANPGTWEGTIPAFSHGTSILWYLAAWDNEGSSTTRTDPQGNPYLYTVINRNPTISVISPNGGEILKNSITIDWSASDPDGDSLTYTIAYNDGGIGWHLITSGLTGNSYIWDVSGIPYSDSILIKVIANDGYGGVSEDMSDFLFTVEAPKPDGVEFPFFETMSIAAIGIAVFVAVGVFRKSRLVSK